MRELIDQVLEDINCESEFQPHEGWEVDLVEFANELAAGVTAEREAEIAATLPVPYTRLAEATAEVSADKIRVPRMVIATATKASGGDWITSTQGRRMRRPKADCIVGSRTLVDNEYVTVVRFVILWRRARD